MSTNSELKVLHDQLLEQMPEGAEHDEGQCPLCAMETADHDTTSGGLMPETFTQEEVEAAVAAATSGLQKRLDELDAQVQETEVGRSIAAAVADKETSIVELQTQLDAAVAARTAAENQLNETNQYWADAIAAHEQELAFAACRDERTAKAKEVGVFNDEYIASNADRFAAMAEDDFANRLAEWQLIAAKAPAVAPAQSKIPTATALVASRTEPNVTRATNLGLISEMRNKRVDPRTLGGI